MTNPNKTTIETSRLLTALDCAKDVFDQRDYNFIQFGYFQCLYDLGLISKEERENEKISESNKLLKGENK